MADAAIHPAWDAFVAAAEGGNHVQTSLWGAVKATLGWRAIRVVAEAGDRIVGGAQLLVRRVAPRCHIGYVTKGPLCEGGDLELAGHIIDELHRVCRQNHVQYLVVQPPDNGQALAADLPRRGFRPSDVKVAQAATLVVDLTQSLDELLADMHSSTRHNIKRSERAGLTYREARGSDLDAFYAVHAESSRRQNFKPYPLDYFRAMWRWLGPAGYLKLLLAEHEGELLSGMLMAPFGDTVVAKVFGWSGQRGNLRPNEGLIWECFRWAKSHGYRKFDQDGIAPDAARAILDGRPLPEGHAHSPTAFKLGFGGDVVMYPEPYHVFYNVLVRCGYNLASSRLDPLIALFNRGMQIRLPRVTRAGG